MHSGRPFSWVSDENLILYLTEKRPAGVQSAPPWRLHLCLMMLIECHSLWDEERGRAESSAAQPKLTKERKCAFVLESVDCKIATRKRYPSLIFQACHNLKVLSITYIIQ